MTEEEVAVSAVSDEQVLSDLTSSILAAAGDESQEAVVEAGEPAIAPVEEKKEEAVAEAASEPAAEPSEDVVAPVEEKQEEAVAEAASEPQAAEEPPVAPVEEKQEEAVAEAASEPQAAEEPPVAPVEEKQEEAVAESAEEPAAEAAEEPPVAPVEEKQEEAVAEASEEPAAEEPPVAPAEEKQEEAVAEAAEEPAAEEPPVAPVEEKQEEAADEPPVEAAEEPATDSSDTLAATALVEEQEEVTAEETEEPTTEPVAPADQQEQPVEEDVYVGSPEPPSPEPSPLAPSPVYEEAGPHLPPTRPGTALSATEERGTSPGGEVGYESDDSFSMEVAQIAESGHGEDSGFQDLFYTRSGKKLVAADVDRTPEMFNSPRFREACGIQGVRPREDLLRRSEQSFVEKGLSKTKIQMRTDFFEAKRVMNAKLVLEEREKVIRRKQREAGVVDDSTMVEKEKHKTEVKRKQMEKRNNMMEEYDTKLRRLRQERQERMDLQEQMMDKARAEALAEFQASETIRYQRAQDKKAETNILLDAIENDAIKKGQVMEQKAAENLAAIHQRQEHEAVQMQEKRKIVEAKIENCLAQDEVIMENKRNKYHEKQAMLKQRYADNQGGRDELKRLNELKQEQAQVRRAEVKARDDFLASERIRKGAERENKMQERERQLENRRLLEKERKKLLDQRQAVKREEIRERDVAIVEKRRNDFFESTEQAKARRDAYFKKRDDEIDIKREEDRLKLEDKLNYLDRHKRIKEHDRGVKLKRMTDDRSRVESMMVSKHELLRKRKEEQQYMWDNRVRIEFVGPGPGEYNLDQRTGSDSPAVSFGVKHEAPRPKLEPGPGAYKTHEMMFCNGQLAPNPSVARIGKGKSKSALDWEIYRAKKIPGPLDYTPQRPSSCPTYKMGKGKALSELDLMLIQAGKTPGPSSYKIPELDPGRITSITSGNPKGYLDWAIYRGKQCPGPQDYEADFDVIKQSCPKMVMTNSKAKSDVEWQMYRAAQQPGPGEYNTQIHFSSGPHGTRNSGKIKQGEASIIAKVASHGGSGLKARSASVLGPGTC